MSRYRPKSYAASHVAYRIESRASRTIFGSLVLPRCGRQRPTSRYVTDAPRQWENDFRRLVVRHVW